MENLVFKSATICETEDFPLFKYLLYNFTALIKVSITTVNTKDMPKLIKGLKVLYKSDPAINYYVNNTGEHILETAGEVHLERAIKDIEDRLCKIELKISPPIIDFREGLINMTYNPNIIFKKTSRFHYLIF